MRRMACQNGSAVRRMAAGRSAPAFTLVELLVVISVIALLIAILLPSLRKARDQAKSVACKANLHGLGRAVLAYAGGNEDYTCSGQVDPRVGANLPTDHTSREQIGMDRVGWVADLNNGGYAQPEMYHCPSSLGQVQKSIKDMAPADLNDAAYLRRLFDKGYTTNYCQSWYMIHTGPNLGSGLLDDEKTWAGLLGQQMRLDIGALRTSNMLKVSPQRVPLLGDAKVDANQSERFDLRALGKQVVLASNATDGPRFFYDQSNVRTRMQYRRATPYLSQDYENFGGAHNRSQLKHIEGHFFTKANLLFADGHVEVFLDRYSGDSSTKDTPADGQVDSWDLEGNVFDGVLKLGRRSKAAEELR